MSSLTGVVSLSFWLSLQVGFLLLLCSVHTHGGLDSLFLYSKGMIQCVHIFRLCNIVWIKKAIGIRVDMITLSIALRGTHL